MAIDDDIATYLKHHTAEHADHCAECISNCPSGYCKFKVILTELNAHGIACFTPRRDFYIGFKRLWNKFRDCNPTNCSTCALKATYYKDLHGCIGKTLSDMADKEFPELISRQLLNDIPEAKK